jgi:hypothetical protein
MNAQKTRIWLFLFPLVFLGECKSTTLQFPDRPNDTANVVQLALRTALFQHRLPEISSLFEGDYSKDSVFVVVDSFPHRLLPTTLNAINFKFGSYREVTGQLREKGIADKRNYLYICCFSKKDSVYSVSIQNRSCVPFGGGGATIIDIVKRSDSMIVQHYSSHSIN